MLLCFCDCARGVDVVFRVVGVAEEFKSSLRADIFYGYVAAFLKAAPPCTVVIAVLGQGCTTRHGSTALLGHCNR